MKKFYNLGGLVFAVTGTGSTYIRWGRKTCNTNGTDLVYTGLYKTNGYVCVIQFS